SHSEFYTERHFNFLCSYKRPLLFHFAFSTVDPCSTRVPQQSAKSKRESEIEHRKNRRGLFIFFRFIFNQINALGSNPPLLNSQIPFASSSSFSSSSSSSSVLFIQISISDYEVSIRCIAVIHQVLGVTFSGFSCRHRID
ncbi:hypothetical protein F2P56_008373, partial [Juglans regia]